MITPFDPKRLFEIGNFNVESYENGVLIIDNWYKNFNEIQNILNNTSVPLYPQPDETTNFLDYYDCRYTIETGRYNYKGMFSPTIISLIKQYFQEPRNLKTVGTPFKFNYFKHIKTPSSNYLQMRPHIDYDYNCVIYIDSTNSGGTCLYPGLQETELPKYDTLFWDNSKHTKIKIQAKPNRMAIYQGKTFHGGFIDDHVKYLNDWRINQVIFMTTYDSN